MFDPINMSDDEIDDAFDKYIDKNYNNLATKTKLALYNPSSIEAIELDFVVRDYLLKIYGLNSNG